MAQTVSIILTPEDRHQLEAITSDRSLPLEHIQRAKIVLYSAERLLVLEVARRAGVSRQRSGAGNDAREEGFDGLLRDKTRKPGRGRSHRV